VVAVLLGFGVLKIVGGQFEWYTFAALALSVLILAVWLSYVKRSARVCEAMPDKAVTVTFTDDSIQFRTSQHNSEYKWTLISAVWRSKSAWLLFTYSPQTYTLLPTASLDSELKQLIVSKVKEHNGKVI